MAGHNAVFGGVPLVHCPLSLVVPLMGAMPGLTGCLVPSRTAAGVIWSVVSIACLQLMIFMIFPI